MRLPVNLRGDGDSGSVPAAAACGSSSSNLTFVSARLPLHYFFLVATILIYYLAFKIAGESIHSLQVAGVIPSHYAGGLPVVGPLGMSQTWETFALQAVVLALVLAEIVTTEARRLFGRKKSAT